MKKLLIAAVMAMCTAGVYAQQTNMATMQPAEGKSLASPRKAADVVLAGKKIHIGYGAPSVRGRHVMGEVVPYTEWWRTGANEATSFETTGDLMVGKLHVPAGKYTLVTLPSAGAWQLVVCKHTGQWGTDRFEADDLGKTAMMKATLPAVQEVMSIGFEKTAGSKTQLHIKWDKTDVFVPVSTR